MTLTPTNGYSVSQVEVKKRYTYDELVPLTSNPDDTWSFYMPEYDVDVYFSYSVRDHFLISHDSDVNITNGGNDMLTQADVTTYKQGETIKFTITPPAETYALESIKVCKTEDENTTVTLTDEGSGNYSFTMPEYDVTIKRNWTVTCYSISKTDRMAISFTSENGTKEIGNKVYYKEGATIQVTVTPPTEGGVELIVADFSITRDDNGCDVPYTSLGSNTYEFTMPAADITLNALFDYNMSELKLLSGTDDFYEIKGMLSSYYRPWNYTLSARPEGPDKLLDGKFSPVNSDNYSKWCVSGFSRFTEYDPCYVEFKTYQPVIPKHYVLITGNDNETCTGRNPKDWTIMAKANSGDEWTTIANVSNDTKMQDSNYTAYTFDFANPDNKTYQYFRFVVNANQGDQNYMQLSEMQLLVKKPTTLTTYPENGKYWTTFYHPTTDYKLVDNENACAYTVTVSGSNIKLHELGRIIPKGTSVLIVGEDSNVSLVETNETVENIPANDLTGTNATIQNPGNAYVLAGGSNGTGFYKVAGDATIEANTAYLTGDGVSEFIGITLTLADNGDNSTTISAFDNSPVHVKLSGRTFYKDGDWNTLCLPFSLSSLTGTPLQYATVKTLESSDFDSTDGTLTLNFSDDLNSIYAGVPYIVKWDNTAYIQSQPIINPSDDVADALDFITELPTVDDGLASNWGSYENRETYDKLVDGNTSTKYGLGSGSPYVEFHYDSPITPKGYALWTANDTEGRRNPTSWTIWAKNDGDTDWTKLVTVDNSNKDKLPMENDQRTIFALVNNTAYKYFRFEATIGDEFQLAELQFCTVQPDIALPDPYIESPVFHYVTIEDKMANVETNYVDFVGQYSRFDITGEDRSILYLGAGNTLYYPNAEMSINACRAHFKLNGLKAEDLAGVRSFVLNFVDNGTTAIEEIEKSKSSNSKSLGVWYTLDGRKVNKPTLRGIYIYNGNKVVIK